MLVVCFVLVAEEVMMLLNHKEKVHKKIKEKKNLPKLKKKLNLKKRKNHLVFKKYEYLKIVVEDEEDFGGVGDMFG